MEKELPKGWIKVELRFLGEYINGRAFKPTEWKDSGLPIIRIQNLNDPSAAFNFSNTEHEPKYLVVRGDLLMAWSASLGVYIWGKDNAWLNQHIFKVLENKEIVTKRFLFYALQVSISEFYKKTHGSGIVHITKPVFESHNVSLPPLPEQHRIVAKLDTLFEQLDRMKTSMERIPQLLKDFRQKVLTQAVTGKLTEEWREGKGLEEWKRLSLNEFSSSRLGKMLDKEKNQGVPTKYLRNINVRWFDIVLDDLFEIKVSEEEIKKYTIQNGDVLVCEGGEPGRAAIWREGDTNIIFQKAIHRVRLNKNVLPELFLYNLKVDSENIVLSSLFTGTTIKHLTGVAFSHYSICIPSLEEQQEIVRRVESLFAKANQIETSYQKLKEKMEQLPQALLAKAFRGELVEQLPTDGDARDLLDQIKEAKAGLEKGGKTKKLGKEEPVRMVAEDGVRYGKRR